MLLPLQRNSRLNLLGIAIALSLGTAHAAPAATDCNAVTEIAKVECESLLQLYHSTDGPNWRYNEGWNVTNTPCSWVGITCENNGVTKIYLVNNLLKGSIPDFSGLSNLQWLILDSNQLTTVPDFSALPSLQELSIGGSQLTTVPDFSALPNLQTLDLWGNQLTTVPDFSALPNLQTLELDENQLTTVPDFSALPSLQVLKLRGNELTTVPNFSALPNLQKLSLWENQLTTVSDFSAMPNLQTLELSGNQLTTVPDFSALPNLQELYIGSNQLTTVPDFSALPNLQGLNLGSNQLTTVPDFSAMPNLQKLGLGGNQLTVPDFSALPNLQELYLWENQLTTVPNFSALPNLQKFYLDSNQLTTVPDFSALPNLRVLDLGDNQLTGPIHDFSTLTQLKSLDLRSNSICKDINIDYTTWSVISTSSYSSSLTWQEQLDTFPYCLSLEPLTMSTTLKAGQALSLKSRIQGPVRRAWVELKPLDMNFQKTQQLALSQTDKNNWEVTWNDAFYNGDYQVTFYAEETSIGEMVNSEQSVIIRVTEGLQPPQQRLAIVIAGGGNHKENSLWDNTESISNAIYAMLRQRNFTDQEIYYLTPELGADYNGDGIDDDIVDTPSPGRPLMVQDIRVALKWAKENGTLGQPLYLFFTGHGSAAENGRLALAKSHYLYTAQTRQFLEEYQQITGNPVVLFIDACYSGVWVEQLQAPQRAIISSARANELAYFTDKKSFNRFLANYLMSGTTLYEAFELARNAQQKMLGKQARPTDDGETNPFTQNPMFGANESDNRWLKEIQIGHRIETGSLTVEVQSTTEATTLPVGQPLTLTATANADSGSAKEVWALIRPPRMSLVLDTHGTPILAFQRLDLSRTEGSLWTGVWNEAVYNGEYEITFYAKDQQDHIASSDSVIITFTGGVEPPAQATVEIVLEKEHYRPGEPFKAELIENLGWGYDLYAAVVLPDGQFMTLTNTNELAPLNQPQNWLKPRTQSQPTTLLDLTLPGDLPTGKYCLYGILSPEKANVFESLEKGLSVVTQRCFEVLP
jgi:Leucine-rich repeat (LRR) protein